EAFAQCFYPQIPFQCALTATKTTGEYPLTVTFDAGVAGGPCPYTYSYDFGDGASDDSAAPTHVYATAGTRMVNLSVTDGDGSQCTGSVSITVLPCTARAPATGAPAAPPPAQRPLGRSSFAHPTLRHPTHVRPAPAQPGSARGNSRIRHSRPDLRAARSALFLTPYG